MARYDESGRQIPNQTPVAIPVGFSKPESLADFMRRVIRTEFSKAAEAAGAESFEDANDFDIADEDPELSSTQYEAMADDEPMLKRNVESHGNGQAPVEQEPGDRPDGEPAGSQQHVADDSGIGTGSRPGGNGSPSAGTGGRSGRPASADAFPDSPQGRTDKARQRTNSAPLNPPKGHYNPRLDGADSED